MLAALVLYFMMGGGGVTGTMIFMNEAAESVEVVVTDEERKDQALAVLDSMLDRTKDHNKELDDMREQLLDVLASHDVTEAQLDTVWNDYFSLDEQYTEEMIASRFELKDSLTREEWSEVFPSAFAETSKP